MAPPKGFVPWNKNLKGIHLNPSTEFKKGNKFSKEHYDKMSKLMKGNTNGFKKKHIPYNKGIIGFNKGHPNYNYNESWNKGKKMSLEFRKKLSESHKGYITPESTKLKLRIIRQEQIDKDGGIVQIGKYEKQILDYIEDYLKTPIIRQFRTAGYFIDGYCPVYNLAVEIDEPFHNNQLEKDKEREQNIKNELNCVFIRIPTNELGL